MEIGKSEETNVPMAIAVRPVNLESESEELLAILEANLPDLPHARRFRWLYRDNPDGPAWSWFAVDQARDSIVGVTSVFPRSMWVGGRVVRCGQVGDFAVSATHRSLGPALLLQRATFGPVDQRSISFCYDCPPHAAGMATFRRLRVAPNCAVTRYALPLRLDNRLKQLLGFTPPLLTPLMNFLWCMARRPTRIHQDLEIGEHTGLFDDEFTHLDDAAAANVIRGCRNAVHLNWRYRQDPLEEYHVLTARRKGELMAFLIFSIRNQIVRIADVFGRDFVAAVPALLCALVRRYKSSCQGIEAYVSDGSDALPAILQAHFHRRSLAAHVVAYAQPGSDISAFLSQRDRWAFHTVELQA
jgi:hypothetical protein